MKSSNIILRFGIFTYLSHMHITTQLDHFLLTKLLLLYLLE